MVHIWYPPSLPSQRGIINVSDLFHKTQTNMNVNKVVKPWIMTLMIMMLSSDKRINRTQETKSFQHMYSQCFDFILLLVVLLVY